MKQLAKGSQDPNIVKEVYGKSHSVVIMRLSILIGFLLLASFALGQAGMVQSVASIGESGGLVKVIPFAPVVVCGYPANTSSPPCSNLITTYTTPTKAGTCSSSTQVIWPGTSACKSTADPSGNFSFFADTGQNATYYFKYLSVWFGPFAVVVGGGGGTPGGSNGQLQVNNLGVFGGVSTPTPVINLFTGCSGIQYLGADGACHDSGASPWNSILAPTGNLSLSLGLNTSLFIIGDFGASPTAGAYKITDSATTTTDTSTNAVYDTGPSSRHNSLAARIQGTNQFQVCWQAGPQGEIVIGSAVACSAISQSPFAKFLVESNTASHNNVRLYQKSTSATGTMLEMNNATAAGTGFNFFTACASASATDTSCSPANILAQLRGDGLFTTQSLLLSSVTGLTQCLHVDFTGLVSGTGVDCGAGGGSSGLSGQNANGVTYAATATTSTASTTPNTNRGTHLIARVNTIQGTATAPVELQVGDCSTAGTITGASTTYTVLYTDVIGCNVVHDLLASASATITIPTPSTLNNPAPIFVYTNNSTHADTLTPTTYTISKNGATAAATATVDPKQVCKVSLDPVNASTWLADCHSGSGGAVTQVNTAGIATGGPITTTGTVTVSGSGSTTTAATAGTGLNSALVGTPIVADGSGNVIPRTPITTVGMGGIWSNGAPLGQTITGTTFVSANAVMYVVQLNLVSMQVIGNATIDVTVCSSCAEVINVCLYNSAANSLLWSGVSSTINSVGAVSANGTQYTALPGVYYLAYSFSGTTAPTVQAYNGGGLAEDLIINKNGVRMANAANGISGGVCPASLGALTPGTGQGPKVMMALEP